MGRLGYVGRGPPNARSYATGWLYHSLKENQHYYHMVGKLLVAPWPPIQQGMWIPLAP